MNRKSSIGTAIAACTLALALPATAAAQAGGTPASLKGGYDIAKDWVTKAAAQMPEEHYSFKATPDVRSFGAIVGHIADANFMICSAASGEKPPMSGIEKSKTTKADLTAALEASFKFCDAAWTAVSGPKGDEAVKFFLPGAHTRLGVMSFNTAHDFEHYGNLVTYMRLKGLVPPSSARGSM